MTNQLKGTMLTGLGVLILSPDAMLIRLMSAEPMTIVFWRGVGIFVMLSLMGMVRHRRGVLAYLRSAGPTGLLVSVCFAICQLGFVGGVATTNPAHVLVMVAATPLVAAIASRILLGERIVPSTAIAIVAGLSGVAIMMSAHLGGGGQLSGDFIAAAVPISLGLAFTLIRRLKVGDVWLLYAISGLIVAAVAAPFRGSEFLSGADILWAGILVLIVVPVSFALITQGPRYITAAEVSLIMLLETVLGPIWVWLVVGIAPTVHALIGGGILLATLALHAWWRLSGARRARRLAQKSEALPLTSQSP
ncbi:DMT family transporter [Amorphus sp. 3PC139-8]|uniref:DMT family transporter n=1 Tax=Amorphus sp. 3PC139-8 TaxID=2735676 RepID=UPI00345D32E9